MPKNFDIGRWVGIALYLLFAWQIASVLTSPEPEDGPIILNFVTLIEFEFILVHSGIFMALLPRRLSLIIFVPFTGVFALVMNSSIPGNAILWLYLAVIFNRMRFAFSNPTPEAKGLNFAFSIIAAATYFLLVFIFSSGAGLVPRFGLTVSYLQSIGYEGNLYLDDSGPIFGGLAHPALAMGVIYFSLIAIYDLIIPRWADGMLIPEKFTF